MSAFPAINAGIYTLLQVRHAAFEIEHGQNRPHGLREPLLHLFQRSLRLGHEQPAAFEPFGQGLPPRQQRRTIFVPGRRFTSDLSEIDVGAEEADEEFFPVFNGEIAERFGAGLGAFFAELQFPARTVLLGIGPAFPLELRALVVDAELRLALRTAEVEGLSAGGAVAEVAIFDDFEAGGAGDGVAGFHRRLHGGDGDRHEAIIQRNIKPGDVAALAEDPTKILLKMFEGPLADNAPGEIRVRFNGTTGCAGT